MPATTMLIAFVAAVFVLGGFIKGVVGLGLPTVTIGLLTLVMPPAEAAAIVVVPSLVTNLWQFAAGARLVALTKRFATALAALCAGVWLAASAISGAGAGTAAALLGASLLVYAIFGLASVRM